MCLPLSYRMNVYCGCVCMCVCAERRLYAFHCQRDLVRLWRAFKFRRCHALRCVRRDVRVVALPSTVRVRQTGLDSDLNEMEHEQRSLDHAKTPHVIAASITRVLTRAVRVLCPARRLRPRAVYASSRRACITAHPLPRYHGLNGNRLRSVKHKRKSSSTPC